MKLEKIVKKTILGISILSSLLISSCPVPERGPIKTGRIKINLDQKEQKGAVTGKVMIPTIENNQIVYKPYNQETNKKAYVEIKEFDEERIKGTLTKSNESYLVEDILTGMYLIEAREAIICVDNDEDTFCPDPCPEVTYLSDTNLVEIKNQETTNEENLELRTNYEKSKHIIYGKIFADSNENPFSNKIIHLHEQGNEYCFSDLGYNAGKRVGSLITSADGSYAFYTLGKHVPNNPPLCLKAPKENINCSWKIPVFKFKDLEKTILEEEIKKPGPIKFDAYISIFTGILSGYK